MDKKMITTIIAVFFAIVVGVIGVTYAVAPSNDSVAYDDSDDYDDDDYYEDDEDDYYDDDYDDDYDYDEDDDYDYSNSGNSGYSSNTSGSSITHYCQASGCYKEGTKTVNQLCIYALEFLKLFEVSIPNILTSVALPNSATNSSLE